MLRIVGVAVCAVLGVACGGSSGTPSDAGVDSDAAGTDGGPCEPETDEMLCETAASCGVVTVADRCGTDRTLVCETCTDCAQSLAARLTAACLGIAGLSTTGQLE